MGNGDENWLNKSEHNTNAHYSSVMLDCACNGNYTDEIQYQYPDLNTASIKENEDRMEFVFVQKWVTEESSYAKVTWFLGWLYYLIAVSSKGDSVLKENNTCLTLWSI